MKSDTYIVMATLNGAEYLAEQMDSLLSQSEPNWNVLIQDDGSTDGTQEILVDYASRDGRFHLLDRNRGSGHSATDNFSALLQAAHELGARYVFCCDQDDVWHPDKVAVMLARLKNLEGQGRDPSLVHHDLEVVGRSLEPIAESFIERMRLSPKDESVPQRLLARNEVTGCAMACNRALLDIALPIPEQAIMHDWWLALCAGFFGHIAFMPETFVKYRQHGANAIGAKSFWHGLNPFTNWIAGWRRGDEEFLETIRQSRAFEIQMAKLLDNKLVLGEILRSYSELEYATRKQRLKTLRLNGLWRAHWFSNLILVFRLLLLSRESRQ